MRSWDQEYAAAVHAIQRLPFEAGGWSDVLDRLTKAAGGWGAQVLGVNPDSNFQFSFVSGLADEHNKEFIEKKGGDPRCNPRARIFNRKIYNVHTDVDLADSAEISKSVLYRDLFLRIDCPHICVARLPDVENTRICAAVVRSKRQGPIREDDGLKFQMLLPALNNAIRLSRKLSGDGAAIVSGLLETLGYPAFLLDTAHRVVSLTSGAEKMLNERIVVRQVQRTIEAVCPATNRAFQKALYLACNRTSIQGVNRASCVPFVDSFGTVTLAEIVPLPGKHFDLRFGPVAVVAFPPRRHNDSFPILVATTFNLTAAESEIATSLLRGCPNAQIARSRKVSVETIKTQIQSIYAKLDVHSRASLMKKLSAYIPIG